jgi:hypothetical protein
MFIELDSDFNVTRWHVGRAILKSETRVDTILSFEVQLILFYLLKINSMEVTFHNFVLSTTCVLLPFFLIAISFLDDQ